MDLGCAWQLTAAVACATVCEFESHFLEKATRTRAGRVLEHGDTARPFNL